MQKFTDFIIEHASVLENKSSEDKAIKFQDLYEAKLKEMGAKSPMDLDENQSEEFFTYLKSLKEIKETTEEVVEAKAEVEEHHTADPTGLSPIPPPFWGYRQDRFANRHP